jgi:hypothetical protein
MNERRIAIVAGDDGLARKVQSALASHNITVLAAGLAAGMSIEQASSMCIPLTRPEPRARALTDEDRRRIAVAEDKRNRRAAKRATKEA